MMTSCFPIIEFIVFTLIKLRSNERKFQEGAQLRSRLRVNGQPINTSTVPLQDPVLNHVSANGSGVGVEGCDYFIESFFGVAHIGGQSLGDAMENGNLLGGLYGDCDE